MEEVARREEWKRQDAELIRRARDLDRQTEELEPIAFSGIAAARRSSRNWNSNEPRLWHAEGLKERELARLKRR